VSDRDASSGADRDAAGTEREPDEAIGDVCWLAATCAECGALVEGELCWNCGVRRSAE
jgi:hypothetical protein